MAGCKRCALKGEKREREKEEKRKEKKEEKMGIKIVFFFFFFCVFFISPRAGFFKCAVVIFQIYKENCIQT